MGTSTIPSANIYSQNLGVPNNNQLLAAGYPIYLESQSNLDPLVFALVPVSNGPGGIGVQVLQNGVYEISFSAKGTATLTSPTLSWGLAITILNGITPKSQYAFLAGNGGPTPPNLAPDTATGQVILNLTALDVIALVVVTNDGSKPDINLTAVPGMVGYTGVITGTSISASLDVKYLEPPH
jgi:hypothetical protein